MKPLAGKIAIVTGASRGVGKGIALGLGEAGATVLITGRTIAEGHAASALPGTIQQTAAEVDHIGGHGIAVRCDHTCDDQTEALFQRVNNEFGHLDILVNSIWGGYEHFSDGTEFWNEREFWTQPIARWERMFTAGVRAHYISSVFAAQVMSLQRSGLIVNISSSAADKVGQGVMYGTAKSADNRMAAIMAHELYPYNVTVVSLYPGLVRTESVLKAAEFFDLSNSESPQFIGRVIAGLALDDKRLEKSGNVLVAAKLAKEYGIYDIDGRQPKPLSE